MPHPRPFLAYVSHYDTPISDSQIRQRSKTIFTPNHFRPTYYSNPFHTVLASREQLVSIHITPL